MKTKKLIATILTVVMLLSIFPLSAFAGNWGEGDTLDDALSELKVGFDTSLLDWLALPSLGVVTQRYTYYQYDNNRTGNVEERPVYCIDPTRGGAYEIFKNVGPNSDGSSTATYIRGAKVADARYKAILAGGYPHMTLTALGLQTKEEGYYATKLALWLYIRGNDPTSLTINPKYGDSDPVAQRVRTAAIGIFYRGTVVNTPEPKLTLTGKPSATAVLDANGEYYVQGIEVYVSGWVGTNPAACGDVILAWDSPPPSGTIVLGTDGEDITSTLNVKVKGRSDGKGMNGTVTVKYPAASIDAETFSPPTLKAEAILPNDDIYVAYAKAGKDTYQRYLVEKDPKVLMTASFVSQVGWEPDEFTGTTGLRIRKLSVGTLLPLAGAVFEVLDPDGKMICSMATSESGVIDIPLAITGNYTVSEVTPPEHHLLSAVRTQSVTVRYGEVAEVTFTNAPYGTLRVVKRDFADGRPLGGASIMIKNITTNATREGITDSSGCVIFDKLPVGAYEILEKISPDGYEATDTVYTVNVLPLSEGETSYSITNKAKPGLRIKKFDQQNMVGIDGITFEVWHDGELFGEYVTDMWGEIELRGLPAGTFLVREKSTREPYILDPTPQWIELKDGQGHISELIFFNLAKPNLTIIKEDSQTGERLPFARFEVKYADGQALSGSPYTTDSEGKIVIENIDILAGNKLEITEVSAPPGFVVDTESRIITLEPGKDSVVTWTNTRKPNLTIRKVDSITGDPIKGGAKFQIWYAENGSLTGNLRDLGIFYTNDVGEIVLTAQEVGWFRISELEPVKGYGLKAPSTQDVFLEAGKDKTVIMENVPLSALVIRKTDNETTLPVSGAWFRVRYLGGTSGTGGTIIYEGVTSSSGSIVLTGLRAGVYICEEYRSAPGYELANPSVQTAYLSGLDQDVVELHFTNAKMGKISILKLDSISKLPIKGVTFKVSDSSGGVIGPNGGLYVTDAEGMINISENLPIGSTVIVQEVSCPDHYIMDTAAQTVKIKENTTHTLTFYNTPKGGLLILKKDSKTLEPISGVVIKVTRSDGTVVGNADGLFTTDSAGQILISDLPPSTYLISEVRAKDGYLLDNTVKTIEIKDSGLYTVELLNTPLGGLTIYKKDFDTHAALKNAVFEVRRINGELIGTYTTNNAGIISIPDISGVFTAREVKQPEGYLPLDETFTIEVRDGQTAVLEVFNKKAASLMIEKTDSVTGKGIYGVMFILYDSGKNPIMQLITDQNGFAYVDKELEAGKFFLRELQQAEGYELDTEWKTIYIEAGKTTHIKWTNKPIMAQIQVVKYSSDYNPVTGTPAGSLLKGAVFEITKARSGEVVGYITTDARGVAASEPLPLSRYYVTEVTAPPFYQLSGERMEAELEYAGQIIRLSAYNKSANLGTEIKKVGNLEVIAGDSMRYDISLANTSNVPLSNFYWSDRLPTDAVRVQSITTGTYNQRLYYRIVYKTNYSEWRTLATNLLSTNNYSYNLSAAALGLMSGEVVTDIKFEFGTVAAGFATSTKPTITVQTLPTLVNGYQITNRCEVGGQYQVAPQISQAVWVTKVLRFGSNPSLPKTGY